MSDGSNACIFCQRVTKLTDEHPWGNWTKDYVKRTSNKHNHANVFVPKPGKPEPAVMRIRAGDPLDSQVKAICGACNSGWMGGIQNAAKPFLIPLFNGDACVPNDRVQTVVSAWIAMATMTGEHLSRDKKRIAISQSDRNWLMNRQSAPSDWYIWIGRYERQKWQPQWVKASFPVLNTEYIPDAVTLDDRRPTLQTTAFTVGQLFAFAMSCHFPEIPRGWDWRTATGARTLLKRVWPLEECTLSWPPFTMTDSDAGSFSGAVIRYFEDLAIRKGYA